LRNEDHAARLAPYALALLRIMAALLFMQHGLAKLFAFPMAMNSPALFSLYWFAAMTRGAADGEPYLQRGDRRAKRPE
jgi:uncharacterized membrane protein YphA (DoxX/SURF4 family)